MNKKIGIALGIMISLVYCFTFCFAADDNNGLEKAADGVRNVVGGAENAIENGAKDIANTSKNATGDMEKGANNATNHAGTENNNTGAATTNNNNNNDGNNGNNGYVATRTATGDATFMGMNATAWTWLVIGIAAIAIIALVWYYGTQLRNNRHDDID